MLSSDFNYRSSYNRIIIVTVGEEKKQADFLVHRDLICERSPFFTAACSNRWAEGQTKVVELPQHHPRIFKAYLQWAYSSSSDLSGILNELYTFEDLNGYTRRSARFRSSIRYTGLVRLWILADDLVDSACKNEVINNLVREVAADWKSPNFPLHLFKRIYERTAPNSGLRKWLVDAMLPAMSSEYLQAIMANLPADLVTDLFKAFMDEKGMVSPNIMRSKVKPAKYYE